MTGRFPPNSASSDFFTGSLLRFGARPGTSATPCARAGDACASRLNSNSLRLRTGRVIAPGGKFFNRLLAGRGGCGRLLVLFDQLQIAEINQRVGQVREDPDGAALEDPVNCQDQAPGDAPV